MIKQRSSQGEIVGKDKTATEFHDGDIFRWAFKEAGNDGAWGRYHCKSQIAVAKDGNLYDTYWSIAASFSGCHCVDPSKVDLTHIANFDELEKRPEYDAAYFAVADIVNLNHANSSKGNFYIRKGAQRSAERMLEVANRKISDAEFDISSAKRTIEETRKIISQIQSGDTSGYL